MKSMLIGGAGLFALLFAAHAADSHAEGSLIQDGSQVFAAQEPYYREDDLLALIALRDEQRASADDALGQEAGAQSGDGDGASAGRTPPFRP